jgi:hypothetical protein
MLVCRNRVLFPLASCDCNVPRRNPHTSYTVYFCASATLFCGLETKENAKKDVEMELVRQQANQKKVQQGTKG